jgi:hypothetical protein
VFLSSIPEEERQFGIEKESLTQWHAGLAVYFSTFPSFILAQVSLFEKGILTLDAQTVKDWSNEIPKYAEDPDINKYIKDLFAEMDEHLSKQASLIKRKSPV